MAHVGISRCWSIAVEGCCTCQIYSSLTLLLFCMGSKQALLYHMAMLLLFVAVVVAVISVRMNAIRVLRV